MIVTLALRSLLSRPVRSAVLAGGFGLGVSVMAALLGIGGVILEQARAPQLLGGGDVVWFDDRTVAIGRGYRTNDEGIRQLRRWLAARVRSRHLRSSDRAAAVNDRCSSCMSGASPRRTEAAAKG